MKMLGRNNLADDDLVAEIESAAFCDWGSWKIIPREWKMEDGRWNMEDVGDEGGLVIMQLPLLIIIY